MVIICYLVEHSVIVFFIGLDRAIEFDCVAFLRLFGAVFKGGFAAFVEELEGVAEAEAVVPLHELDDVAGLAAIGSHTSE